MKSVTKSGKVMIRWEGYALSVFEDGELAAFFDVSELIGGLRKENRRLRAFEKRVRKALKRAKETT